MDDYLHHMFGCWDLFCSCAKPGASFTALLRYGERAAATKVLLRCQIDTGAVKPGTTDNLAPPDYAEKILSFLQVSEEVQNRSPFIARLCWQFRHDNLLVDERLKLMFL